MQQRMEMVGGHMCGRNGTDGKRPTHSRPGLSAHVVNADGDLCWLARAAALLERPERHQGSQALDQSCVGHCVLQNDSRRPRSATSLESTMMARTTSPSSRATSRGECDLETFVPLMLTVDPLVL